MIDLSHGVPPTNVQAGAMTFRDCIAFAPPDGVLLGVVDPGVGTDRKAIAVETASGRILVGPDNGLLSLAWEAAGGPTRAFEITALDVLLQPVSSVFHGRDVFAAGRGAPRRRSATRRPGTRAEDRRADHVDAPRSRHPHRRDPCGGARRGSVRQRPAERPTGRSPRRRVWSGSALKVGDDRRVGPRRPRVDLRGGRATGEPTRIIEDAWGWITVIRFEANAAAELGVRPGDAVWLMASDG